MSQNQKCPGDEQMSEQQYLMVSASKVLEFYRQ